MKRTVEYKVSIEDDKVCIKYCSEEHKTGYILEQVPICKSSNREFKDDINESNVKILLKFLKTQILTELLINSGDTNIED